MKTRIFLSGCSGRMGRMITELVEATDDLQIVAGSDLVDVPAHYPIYHDPRQCSEAYDVLLDFSNPAALPAIFDLVIQRRKPAVFCTTGLDQVLQERLLSLTKSVAVFQSANMSLGINLLLSLARQAASLLYPEFDIEIIEAHHNQKLDAPSGTALMLAHAINESLDGQMHYVYDRSNVRSKRDGREIGISAIRGGSIVGEHSIIFAGQDEVVTLQHSARSRMVFARGALAAVRFISGKPAGLYSMTDLIGKIPTP